jgi:stringent starvation protein B
VSENAPSPTPTKPYFLRALYEWCVDNGFTPYIAVVVDEHTRVPREHVKDGSIVLNIGPLASNTLKMGNEWIEFQARFGGVARDIVVPVGAVAAIYARETGQGMSFEMSAPEASGAEAKVTPAAAPAEPASMPGPTAASAPKLTPAASSEPPEPPAPPAGGRPALKRVK